MIALAEGATSIDEANSVLAAFDGFMTEAKGRIGPQREPECP
jgi:hypothetical protein